MTPQHDPDDLAGVAADLIARKDEVARAVTEDLYGIRKREPWLELPENLDQDDLPDLIEALARAALETFFAQEQRENVVREAVKHGEHRREQGYPENLIYREFTILRRALWQEVRHRYAGTGKASAAVVRLDAAITLAIGGSLRGFYRATLEASGEWPAAVDRLTRDFSFGTG